jgi:anti-sigma B factor antagonist
MTLADVRVEKQGRIVIARLDGEVDMSNAGGLGESLTNHLSNDSVGLVVDMTHVRYLDSFGIQVLYELHDRLRKRGQELRVVVSPGTALARTLALVDAPRAIGIVGTTDEAVAALAAAGEAEA